MANENGLIYYPYSSKKDGEWITGKINVNFLEKNYGECETATEMKEATNSEGLKLFFDYLAEQGKIPE